MTDRDRYFDMIVLRVAAGEECGQWTTLIDFIMTADAISSKKVSRQFPELMAAIDRYNKKHPEIVESKLIRKVR